MKLSRTELSYRRSAIEGASPIGLMIALFDTLVGDLRRAAAALHNNDIEGRCRQYNHALLVLGQLESWLDRQRGGRSADAIAAFYAYTRAKMMEAAVQKSASILEKQIDMIVQVRSAWQLLDTPAPPTEISLAQQRTAPSLSLPETQPERVPFSQSV
jgi:flagellar protein FliS